ncbi:MAG TPA: Uma2 family endonuclease [Longimicrobium sp.]|nr:Uma2 family endonuclease [Longimicrobium sp.]
MIQKRAEPERFAAKVRECVSGYAARRFLVRARRGRWIPEPGEIVVLDLGREATVADLHYLKGKAEIVDGRLEVIAPASFAASRAAGAILSGLMTYGDEHDGGWAFGSTLAYLVDLPHRKSLCPDAAWYTGPRAGAGFPPIAPVFAAEIRDDADYREEYEDHFTAKRADYFAAGTQVVWDVDVLREELIRVYRADDPENPTIYRRGEVAEAEPAVPGWRFPVDELFD